MEFGLLMPHFGPSGTRERAFGLGADLARSGFTSAWFRDHLGFSGGVQFERSSTYFVDPFVAMSAIAATTQLTVGTAALTPIRHPVALAQLVGSLAHLADGRLVLGVGLGKQHAVDLVGRGDVSREDLLQEMVDVLRACATPNARHHGPVAHFDSLTLDPAPPKDLPIWYCGSSLAGIGRVLALADGWLPGRCPFTVFDRLQRRLTERAATLDKKISTGIIPLVSIAKTRERALARINVEGLLATFRAKTAWRTDSEFRSPDDLRGALVAGNEQDVLEDLHRFEERGVQVVVLDLRERMEDFDEALAFIGERIVPQFAPGAGRE